MEQQEVYMLDCPSDISMDALYFLPHSNILMVIKVPLSMIPFRGPQTSETSNEAAVIILLLTSSGFWPNVTQSCSVSLHYTLKTKGRTPCQTSLQATLSRLRPSLCLCPLRAPHTHHPPPTIQEQPAVPGLPPGYSTEKVTT